MRPSRKLAHGSLAVLLLTSGAGCAGSRLANMFSMTPKSDYKTIEELEMEAERQEAERQALLADGTVEEPEQPVKEGPLSGLLARMTGKGPVESDPFLELENQTVDENRIAEEKHLAELEKKLEQERTALQELKKSRVAEADDALTDEFNKLVADSKDASGDFEDLAAQFAASEASEASDPNADLPRGDDSFAAFINEDAENKFGSQIRTDRVQPDLNEDTFASIETQTRQNVEETEASAAFGETSANPADALQAFLARNGHPVDSEPSTRLVSASKPSSSRAGDEFDAFAGLVQDRPDTAKPAINSHAGTQTADSKHSAFDSLLADATPRTSGDSSFDMNSNMGESNIESDPFGFDPSFIESPRKPVVADSMQQNSAKANDLFASVDQTAAKPLTDATGFEWKQDPKTEEETNWWSNGDSQPAQMNPNAPSRSSFPVQQPSNRSTTSQYGDLSIPGLQHSNSFQSATAALPIETPPLKPATSGHLLKTPAIQTASLTRSSATQGFESDPFFTTSHPVDLADATDVVAAQAPEVIRTGGLFARMTARSWGLAAGGIIVLFLLFAPGRKKPTQSQV